MAARSKQGDGSERNRANENSDSEVKKADKVAKSRAFGILKSGIKTTGDLKKFLVGAAYDVFANTVTVKEGNFAVSTANGIVRIKSFELRLSERDRGLGSKPVAI